jgi:hypothetical protein
MHFKHFLPVCALILFSACSKQTNELSNEDNLQSEKKIENQLVSGRQCASYELLQQDLKSDPGLAKRMKLIESVTENVLKNPAAFRLLADGTIEIPVHINVLFRTTAENISNTQIQSQIDVLNEDFAGTNADRTLLPSLFSSVFGGNSRIIFTWNSTTGLTRKSTKKTSWSTNNDMKRSSRGGINPTSPTTKLNIWVCTISNGILGYAQFPGGTSATDGVVVLNTAFGRTGTVRAPFNRGRTTTHEVGHWLNLRHIWGDATCGSDQVGDTPPHNTANYGCPAYPHLSTCTGTPVEMTMNYMDYSDDACMYMFSLGQVSRMKATFASGGGRTSFAQP